MQKRRKIKLLSIKYIGTGKVMYIMRLEPLNNNVLENDFGKSISVYSKDSDFLLANMEI